MCVKKLWQQNMHIGILGNFLASMQILSIYNIWIWKAYNFIKTYVWFHGKKSLRNFFQGLIL